MKIKLPKMPKELRNILVVVSCICLAGMTFHLYKNYSYLRFMNSGDSMLPYLHHGDTVEVFLYDDETLQRGDLVVMKALDGINEYWVRRIIGLPGDRVSCIDSVVYVNGEALKEEYLEPQFVKQQTQANGYFTSDFEEYTVDENYVYVLCDNRLACEYDDSRWMGVMSIHNIRGHNVSKISNLPIK